MIKNLLFCSLCLSLFSVRFRRIYLTIVAVIGNHRQISLSQTEFHHNMRGPQFKIDTAHYNSKVDAPLSSSELILLPWFYFTCRAKKNVELHNKCSYLLRSTFRSVLCRLKSTAITEISANCVSSRKLYVVPVTDFCTFATLHENTSSKCMLIKTHFLSGNDHVRNFSCV